MPPPSCVFLAAPSIRTVLRHIMPQAAAILRGGLLLPTFLHHGVAVPQTARCLRPAFMPSQPTDKLVRVDYGGEAI